MTIVRGVAGSGVGGREWCGHSWQRVQGPAKKNMLSEKKFDFCTHHI